MHLLTELLKAGSAAAMIAPRTEFRVYEELDKTEGRGGRRLRYIVEAEADAQKLAAGLGVMGTAGPVERVDMVVLRVGAATFAVPLSYIVADDSEGARLAGRAALKLSPAERRALGL